MQKEYNIGDKVWVYSNLSYLTTRLVEATIIGRLIKEDIHTKDKWIQYKVHHDIPNSICKHDMYDIFEVWDTKEDFLKTI